MVKGAEGGLVASVKRSALTVGGVLALMWALEVVDFVLGGALDGLGVRPRELSGLVGILFAPFLHVGFAHLAMNSVAFVMLAPLTMVRRRMDFWVVSVATALSSGLGAWLVGGSHTVHLGLSGVIFGYLGFLLARGVYERSAGAIAMSVGVLWFFGSMLWGVVPFLQVGVSWEAHLFGFLGGVAVARLLGRQLRR